MDWDSQLTSLLGSLVTDVVQLVASCGPSFVAVVAVGIAVRAVRRSS